MQLSFTPLTDAYAITRLAADAEIPEWMAGPGLVSMTRADDELSLVCRADRVPHQVGTDGGWAALRVDTLADLDEPGVVMTAVTPLSSAGFGVFVISTHLRDYLLVRQRDLPDIKKTLIATGHTIG